MRGVQIFLGGQKSSGVDGIDVQHLGELGLTTAQNGVSYTIGPEANLIIAAEDESAGEHRRNFLHRRAVLANGHGIFVGELLAQANFFGPRLQLKGFEARDKERFRAQLLHLARHVSIEAVDDRGHADDAGHPHHHAQHGEEAAQLLTGDCGQGNAQALFPFRAGHASIIAGRAP